MPIGTLNNNGSVEGFTEVRMTIGDHSERIKLAVTNLGSSNIFLSLEWLHLHNLDIDWTASLLSFNCCPDKCSYHPWWSLPEEGEALNWLNEEDWIFLFDWEGYINNHRYIRLMSTLTDKYINDFPEVFKKQGFDSLLEWHPWDHAIELTPRSKPINCKVYPLNLDKQKALDEFLEENLKSGQICHSNSPMTSPFFFVKKKDGAL